MKALQQSIIRNGNHFILMGTAGWILIDGPWYRELPTDENICFVQQFTDGLIMVEDPAPTHTERSPHIVWERKRWLSHYDALLLVRRGIMRDSRLWVYYNKLCDDFRIKWGWRIYPDGPLPIMFDAIEWQEGMERSLDFYSISY